jgi:fumarate reductase flavoprotein subunit
MTQAADEQRRLEQEILHKHGGRERIADVRLEMQRTLEECASIYRTGRALAGGLGKLARLQERAADLALDDRSRTFNTERLAALELTFMLDVAETIVHAAYRREESRGAHQRSDFPARDDARFLAHSLISRRADGSCAVEYLPVRITRWPPAERVYGEAAAHAGSHHAAGVTLSSGAGV